jgi:hypothetical protein
MTSASDSCLVAKAVWPSCQRNSRVRRKGSKMHYSFVIIFFSEKKVGVEVGEKNGKKSRWS